MINNSSKLDYMPHGIVSSGESRQQLEQIVPEVLGAEESVTKPASTRTKLLFAAGLGMVAALGLGETGCGPKLVQIEAGAEAPTSGSKIFEVEDEDEALKALAFYLRLDDTDKLEDLYDILSNKRVGDGIFKVKFKLKKEDDEEEKKKEKKEDKEDKEDKGERPLEGKKTYKTKSKSRAKKELAKDLGYDSVDDMEEEYEVTAKKKGKKVKVEFEKIKGEKIIEAKSKSKAKQELAEMFGYDSFEEMTEDWEVKTKTLKKKKEYRFRYEKYEEEEEEEEEEDPEETNDKDQDMLSDTEEADLGTDPLNPDTDGDGLSDGYEVIISLTDPLDEDTNDNGIHDYEEIEAKISEFENQSFSLSGKQYPKKDKLPKKLFDELIQTLINNPYTRIEIEVHGNKKGGKFKSVTRTINLAKAINDYFIDKGKGSINKERVYVRALVHRLNRRVTIDLKSILPPSPPEPPPEP